MDTKRTTARRVLIFVTLAILCAVFIRGFIFGSPKNFPEGGGIVTIEPGETLQDIGDSLEESGYVRSSVLLSTLVTLFGGERTIEQGDYFFESPQSVLTIARQIAAGNHNLQQIKVTLPEGVNVREIGNILATKLPDFDADAFTTTYTKNEGYLFPETYFFFPKTTAETIGTQMQSMFSRKTASILTEESLGTRTDSEIIIMASILEREAHGATDRAVIAGILWNRLDNGMALQVDATVAYAAGVPEKQLKKSHFSIDSKYNTYMYKGLPPAPISNPGLETIEAALNPEKTSYVFYLHAPDGSVHYAKTYAEHQKNINRYLR